MHAHTLKGRLWLVQRQLRTREATSCCPMRLRTEVAGWPLLDSDWPVCLRGQHWGLLSHRKTDTKNVRQSQDKTKDREDLRKSGSCSSPALGSWGNQMVYTKIIGNVLRPFYLAPSTEVKTVGSQNIKDCSVQMYNSSPALGIKILPDVALICHIFTRSCRF